LRFLQRGLMIEKTAKRRRDMNAALRGGWGPGACADTLHIV